MNKQIKYFLSFSFLAQDGIVALGKARTRPAPSLSSLPKVALETVLPNLCNSNDTKRYNYAQLSPYNIWRCFVKSQQR